MHIWKQVLVISLYLLFKLLVYIHLYLFFIVYRSVQLYVIWNYFCYFVLCASDWFMSLFKYFFLHSLFKYCLSNFAQIIIYFWSHSDEDLSNVIKRDTLCCAHESL